MIYRLAAIAAISLSVLFAQSDPAPSAPPPASADAAQSTPPAAAPSVSIQPDETDPLVLRARENLVQIQKLVGMGALPQLRLRKAQDEIQDALDMSILKKSLYASELLPEQADEMVLIAQKMVLRRQRSMAEMQQLVSAGVISRAEAEMTTTDLERSQRELDWAKSRALLIQELAESLRLQKGIASLEDEAESHPEWAGKVYMRYDGKGIFTPADRQTIELAFTGKFSKPLPISADGETAVHRSLGFDHRGRIDVALNPDQPEGVWLRRYLETKHIPYFAFRSAVPHMATGAHIHIGPGSTKYIAGSEAAAKMPGEKMPAPSPKMQAARPMAPSHAAY